MRDLILKKSLKRRVDWSQIDDREIFMKGIDYSYYYESDDPSLDPTRREKV